MKVALALLAVLPLVLTMPMEVEEDKRFLKDTFQHLTDAFHHAVDGLKNSLSHLVSGTQVTQLVNQLKTHAHQWAQSPSGHHLCETACHTAAGTVGISILDTTLKVCKPVCNTVLAHVR